MKKLLFITVLVFGVLSLQAQELTFWHKVNSFLTKPAVVDTTCIYQPKPCFSLGLFTTGQKAGFDVDVNFGINMPDGSPLTGISSYSLGEGLCKKIGLEAGYGNVGFGYGLEVGPRSAAKKSSFAFNIVGKSWGLRLNYFKITNQFISGLTLGEESDEFYLHDKFTSEEMAALRSFTIDGYYVFNNKRFAYPAAYKMGLVQRRTAGSWMLTARYMQGNLYNSHEAAMDSYNLLDCFATMQASVGGGYSVNFVPWHRDPVGQRNEGLRNLTINLTAMPVITLFNYLKTTSYEYDEDMNLGEKTSKVMCYPMPNYIGSAAVSLTMGRVYFSTQFTYNRFFFRSRDAINNSQLEIPDNLTDLDYRGIFHDWMLKGLLVYRF
ncbi:MAG: DUF4421 family protein [Bacteroidales bacterium]|nr:DUF4421 family protein [Bacteroidales bacterium]